MKKILTSVVAVAMIAAAFTGCKKKDGNKSSGNSGSVKLEMYYYKQEK